MDYSDEDKAVFKIKAYLNKLNDKKWTKEYVLKNYGVAVQMLIEQANTSIGVKGAKSITENGTSITFVDGAGGWTITNDIKEFLPKPFVKLMG